jgi:hypothetical protein
MIPTLMGEPVGVVVAAALPDGLPDVVGDDEDAVLLLDPHAAKATVATTAHAARAVAFRFQPTLSFLP